MNITQATAESRKREAAAKKNVKYQEDLGYLKTYGTWPGQEPAATKPAWIDGTATPGQAQINRRAPIVPIPSAILVQEDDASLDTKRPLGSGDSTRPVVDRTTGRTRTEEEEENRLRGAVLLR
jgi:hypothetical protein